MLSEQLWNTVLEKKLPANLRLDPLKHLSTKKEGEQYLLVHDTLNYPLEYTNCNIRAAFQGIPTKTSISWKHLVAFMNGECFG